MNNPRFVLGVVMTALLSIAFVGCDPQKGGTATYLGDTNQLPSLATPTGFTVTPTEANNIRIAERGNSIAVHHVYHSGDSYYVCDAFFGSKEQEALTRGLQINGQTGAVFDDDAGEWGPKQE